MKILLYSLIVVVVLAAWVTEARAGSYSDEFKKGTIAMEYSVGIGGCLGENCVRPTPSLSMDIGFAIFPRSFVAIIPTFSFALLGTDYSPPEKGYAYTSGTLIMPGVRVEVRHKVNKAMVVSVYSGAGMAWYSKTGVQENMVSDTIKSDFGSFVQLGFGVKYHLFVLELMAGIGGRLHTWADQEGPLASYYIHLGFAVKFVGF